MSGLTDAKRRIVEHLKRVDTATAPELAEAFQLTDTAVRQHLDALAAVGLVEKVAAAPTGRGRPPVHWRLTPLADDLFPDRHGELTVGLLDAVRDALGEEGLERVLAARASAQERSYRAALPDASTAGVRVRVRRLAALRTAEGYLADVVPEGRSSMLLVEHHCPVCEAATSCRGLCSSELALFQRVLGDDVTVERVSHLLSGDQRCAYRITSKR